MMGEWSHSLGVIVFLRCPKPGAVKTRLARTVGDERACDIYEACAAGVLGGLLRLVATLGGARLYVFFSVAEEAEEVKHWVERCIREEPVVGIGVGAGGHSRSFPISYHPQKQTGCLGERMVDAFSFVEAQGHTWIGIFGTDVPDLANESVVLAGLRALGWDFGGAEEGGEGTKMTSKSAGGGVRALLGPSQDGGFYMLLMTGVEGGFVGAHRDLFRGIEWSTGTVLEETSKALKRAGIETIETSETVETVDVDEVPRLRDLDEWEDVVAWMEEQGPGYERQTRLVEVLLKPSKR